MTYDLTPAAVDVVRTWAGVFRDTTTGHRGTVAVGLRLGYGGGDPREAQSALGTMLRRRRCPARTLHQLAYLIYATSPDTSWPRLRLATPAAEWAQIANAVDAMRGFDPSAVPTLGEAA